MHSKSNFSLSRFSTRRSKSRSTFMDPSSSSSPLLDDRRSKLNPITSVRRAALVVGALNIAVACAGTGLLAAVLDRCVAAEKGAVGAVSAAAALRVATMIGAGVAQGEAAAAVAVLMWSDAGGTGGQSGATGDPRRDRKMRYKRWLWWARVGTAVTILQFLGAVYLMLIVATDFSNYRVSKGCFLGQDTSTRSWKQTLVVCFLVLVWIVAIIQCFTGSDILRWRSFYATHDSAWKAHYQEVFDYGIREALCCLGRVRYLSVLEEDEVYSVARLLGDLVAYRASGTGHLELLAGLALMQRQRQSLTPSSCIFPAPEQRIREATFFHPFAEAAYTGPLLDLGRNPVLFPCAWLYRQGVLTPWSRSRRPKLDGDNWWRGHAAAFLRCVNLAPEALLLGRVSQKRREAAYFVVVLHEEKSIVIAVRGTETPEDLLTDGLCRDCALSVEDLDGLINSDHASASVRQQVLSSFPHFGHAGIVESARELLMQLDGRPGEIGNPSSESYGFLSSLLGLGCECYGYKVRIVGHSLGGAVATLLGLMLYRRYPNLHVYAYGALPCVDKVIAEACVDFVTCIVYGDEFSARLSVNSIIRVRAAAIRALSDAPLANSAIMSKLARRILYLNKCVENENSHSIHVQQGTMRAEDSSPINKRKQSKYNTLGNCTNEQGLFQNDSLFTEESSLEIMKDALDEYNSDSILGNGFQEINPSDLRFDDSDNVVRDEAASYLDVCTSSIEISLGETMEMFLPGLVIHIVPDKRSTFSLWKGWKVNDRDCGHKAFVADREAFKDIVVTPYMFLDHLPWRCQSALERVLETMKIEREGIFDESAV